MANVVVTMKVMPEGVDSDLDAIASEVKKHIVAFAGKGEIRVSKNPVAFGLQELQFIFVCDEAKGSTEHMEKKIAALPNVNSVDVTDVRRAIG